MNHTGHPPKVDLLAIADADWHNGLDIVPMNVVRMVRLVTPTWRRRGGAPSSNISSFAAYEPDADFPVSASLRAARIPMDRYGTVEEVAKTAAFLLSDDPGYITGQTSSWMAVSSREADPGTGDRSYR